MRTGIRFGIAAAAALAFTPAWAGDTSADAADARAGASAAVKDTKALDSNGAQQRESGGVGVNDALAEAVGGSDEPAAGPSEDQQSGAEATLAPRASDPDLQKIWSAW
jgi:hypothetical protein